MRLDIKTVKNKDYLQIVDNKGYLHHIGPATLPNLVYCIYIIGFDKEQRLEEPLDALKTYLYNQRQDLINDNKSLTMETIFSIMSRYYYDGLSWSTPPDDHAYGLINVEEETNKILDRIELFEMLEGKIKQEFDRRGQLISQKELHKITQSTYRHASEQQKDVWMKELEEERQKKIDRILSREQS